MNTTRASLLARVRNRNDSSAWEEFNALYLGLIKSYARARGLNDTDATDVAADCMQRLVSNMPDFDYDRQKGRFRAWLRRMVNNRVTDIMRKNRVRFTDDQGMRQVADDTPTPDEIWDKKWHQAHLVFCLQKLQGQVASRQFEAFRLYAIEEWTVEKVMKKLGMTANQVYIAKTRLTSRLRETMNQLFGDQE